jgi:chorismate mutase
VLQASRYDEILQKRVAQAAHFGMSPDFIQAIFVAIHEESVRHQMEIMR